MRQEPCHIGLEHGVCPFRRRDVDVQCVAACAAVIAIIGGRGQIMHEQIGTVTARQRVIARPPKEGVIARATVNTVIARAAIDQIIARAQKERFHLDKIRGRGARADRARLGACKGQSDIGALAACVDSVAQRFQIFATCQSIVAKNARQQEPIITRVAHKAVIAQATVHGVIAAVAAQLIVVRAAIQKITCSRTPKCIIARVAIDRIGVRCRIEP